MSVSYGRGFMFDWTYLLVLLGVLICSIASAMVHSAMNKYAKVAVLSGMTGAEAARQILNNEGLYHVQIECLPGNDGDHFDPSTNTVRLSRQNYNTASVTGIPRVLDAGQCNDSYSLALIALKLKEVFELQDINELPIIYNIAWYEQKAVIVLLSLLYLGVKEIHLGPTLPAFLSPNVAKVLVENFGIGGITNVEDDIEMFMNM